MIQSYDAILVVAFGGPERPEDVLPFLENVVRGRNVPRERLLEVAGHYEHLGGRSPLNDQVRDLIAALRAELDAHGIGLPIYWGNRNWHPLLSDAMRQMDAAGVRRAMALVLAAYSSYSSCRQYLQNIDDARKGVGDDAPQVDKVRVFYNHPEFIAANAERLTAALQHIPAERRSAVHVAFTAHSIPGSMAAGCDYERQLAETCRLIAETLNLRPERYRLVYQSRSGRPQDPWLGTDICDHLRTLAAGRSASDVVVMPVGFLSDHVEVLFDLDDEAQQVAREVGLNLVRASTVGTHPQFIAMLRELIEERLTTAPVRRAIGRYGPSHDQCPADCCPLAGTRG